MKLHPKKFLLTTEIIAEAEKQQVEAIVVGSHSHGVATGVSGSRNAKRHAHLFL